MFLRDDISSIHTGELSDVVLSEKLASLVMLGVPN